MRSDGADVIELLGQVVDNTGTMLKGMFLVGIGTSLHYALGLDEQYVYRNHVEARISSSHKRREIKKRDEDH